MPKFQPEQGILEVAKSATRRVRFSAKRYAGFVSIMDRIGFLLEHPWFSGIKGNGLTIPPRLAGHLPETLNSIDLAAPILFLARGHSGTTPLAKILATAGVYVGNLQDKYALNKTLDALYWVYGFQRTLVPRLFKPGVGCLVDGRVVTMVALECLRRHLRAYTQGLWGLKACAGMFSYSLYQYIFPRAKYIYLVRDGRDVVLSDNGFFHSTHPFSRRMHWEYFKIITFGISDDIDSCPFKFPQEPHNNDEVMRHRFWVQAKSWREHVRMVEHLRRTKQISTSNVHTVRYEELCTDPIPVLEQLFHFLELELTSEVEEFAISSLHTKSVWRWKEYDKYISDYDEDMASVFASMEPELASLGYTE